MAPMLTSINKAADALAAVFSDYRESDGLQPPNRASVLDWIEQFEESDDDKVTFLNELSAIYAKTYYSLSKVQECLRGIVSQKGLVGADPKTFWESIDVLNVQSKGTSQSDLRQILAAEVKARYNVRITSHTGSDRHSLYLDDAIFSGNCALWDIKTWAESHGEPERLTIIALDVTTGGEYSLKKRLASDLHVTPVIWHITNPDNRSNAGSKADVLRLRSYPKDAESEEFLENRLGGGPAALLRGVGMNSSDLFTDEPKRHLVESVFWRAGLKCLNQCQALSDNVRPLGYCSASGQNKLGFGSLFASYRNCPNNAPVALWAGNPWTPLLRRKIN